MGDALHLIIPGDANELSPNRRFHWRARHSMQQEWQEKARVLWLSAGQPYLTGKVRISFIIRRRRRLDEANLHGCLALKAIEDGLKGYCFHDDSPRYVEWGSVTQEQIPRYEVEVIVEEVTPEP